MNTQRQSHSSACFLAPIVLATLLTACSSGGTQSNTGMFPDRVVTRGTVSTQNNVSVNGRPISVSDAAIYLDDQLVDSSALRSGMQVILQRQNGRATDIHYEEDVKGPVDEIDIAGNLVVMGQSVLISSNTLFDDSPGGAISAGDIVEVSGLRDSNGRLHASYIKKKLSQPNAFKVQGPIAQLNTADQTFVIGELVIDYIDARFDGISESALREGLFVEVKDENRIYEPGSLLLRASKIERSREVSSIFENSSSSSNAQRTEIEIESFVTRIVSDDVFELGGLTVIVSSNTRFRNGDRTRLSINSRIEVEGWLNTNSELEAWEIEFEDGSGYFDSDSDDSDSSSGSSSDNDDETDVELEGIVSALSTDEGLIVINGIDIRVGSRTEFENGQDQYITRNQFFNLIDIGRTVVKVKWKRFNSYTDAPHEVEIEI